MHYSPCLPLRSVLYVLQVTAGAVVLHFTQDLKVPNLDPELALKLNVNIEALFLNNSYSRWEELLNPWSLSLAMTDPINPIFKSNRTR